jgi:hypothetical protein
MSNAERLARDEFKKEYLKGLREAEEMHKGCMTKVLEIVKDRLTETINDSVTLEDAQDEMEKLIQLIDEYIDGEITADELGDKQNDRNIHEITRLVDEIESDEIISLTDFVREDF